MFKMCDAIVGVLLFLDTKKLSFKNSTGVGILTLKAFGSHYVKQEKKKCKFNNERSKRRQADGKRVSATQGSKNSDFFCLILSSC